MHLRTNRALLIFANTLSLQCVPPKQTSLSTFQHIKFQPFEFFTIMLIFKKHVHWFTPK